MYNLNEVQLAKGVLYVVIFLLLKFDLDSIGKFLRP